MMRTCQEMRVSNNGSNNNNKMKKRSSTIVIANDPAFRANPSILRNKTLWSAVALQQELSKSVLTQPRRSNRNKLSLGQKLGIAEKPETPLSQEEWLRVEKQAIQRKTVEDPCSICMEVLGLEKQVILNCSHIFHIACLTSFERFTRQHTHNKLTCPLCRKEEYQKKLTTEGRRAYLNRSATIIQKLWRGYRVRKLYRKALLDLNPTKKMQYYAKKLGSLSDKLIRHQQAQDRSIEVVLANTDYNIRKARLSFLTAEDWEKIIKKAEERCQKDCPICMTALKTTTPNASSVKSSIITSCGHSFHSQCISSFENFNPFDKVMCPMCRSPYLKHDYVLEDYAPGS